MQVAIGSRAIGYNTRTMIKVAMIGAGSVVFSKNLTGDILSFPEFKDATFSYMDIDADRLEADAERWARCQRDSSPYACRA